MLRHLLDLLQVGGEKLPAVLLGESRQVILVVRVEDDVGAVARRRHLDGGEVAQSVDGVGAVLGHTGVHVAQAVAAAVDGQPRLARELGHAVVEEPRPGAALGLPVDPAVEGGGAVEPGHVGTHAQPHAEALAALPGRQIAGGAAHGRRGDVLVQERLVVAEAARREDDGTVGADVALGLVVLVHHDAHDAPVVVLHEGHSGALEVEIDAVGVAVVVHGVGGVFHLQHVVVQRRALRGHVHRHLAQTPVHAAIGHPVQRLSALAGEPIDELRVGRVVVLVHGPIGQRLGIEGIAREGELLLLLARVATQNAAHASLLGVAAGKPHGLHADDVGAQLNRAGRRVQAAAAGAHHADVALVVPAGRHGPGRDGRGVVGGKRAGIMLAVGAVGGGGVGGGGRLGGHGRGAVGGPVAAAHLGGHGRLGGGKAQHGSPGGGHGRAGQEVAAGKGACTRDFLGHG